MTRKRTIIHFNASDAQLEGILSVPERHASLVPGAIICHPHPQYGGDMDNNVVCAVSDALERLPLTVLRFNFRGVNGSGGIHDGGRAEVRDVLAALDFVSSQAFIDSDLLSIVGYSFGAFVGLQAALRTADKVKAIAAISPPVAVYDFGFLQEISTSLLIVAGDNDDYCPESELARIYDTVAAPKQQAIITGANHFYWGKEAAVARQIADFLKQCYTL